MSNVRRLPLMRLFYAFWFVFCAGWGYVLAGFAESDAPPPDETRVASHLSEQLANASIESAVLEKKSPVPACCRTLAESDVRAALG